MAETVDPSGPQHVNTIFVHKELVSLGCGSNQFHAGQENEIKNNREV